VTVSAVAILIATLVALPPAISTLPGETVELNAQLPAPPTEPLSPTLSPLRGAREEEGETSTPTATSTEIPTPTPTPTPTETPTSTSTATEIPPHKAAPRSEDDTWLDHSRGAVARRLVQAISWFDHFFGDREHDDFEHNASSLLLRQELRVESGPRALPRVDARLDLRMPQLGERFERLHFVLYAQTVARDVADAVLTVRDGLAGAPRGDVADAAGGAAELRFDLVRAFFAHADLGGGVHVQLPPGAYVRARLRSTFAVAPRTVARFTELAFLDTIQRLGASAHGQLEHQLDAATLLRADAVASVAQTSRGWEWGGELSGLRALTSTTALGLSAGFAGHGQGGPIVDTWRLATRLRAEAFRRWLYVEAEPEVAWPIDAVTRARRRVFAFTVRLDVQFSADLDPAAPLP
jgi:hypothetical protein